MDFKRLVVTSLVCLVCPFVPLADVTASAADTPPFAVTEVAPGIFLHQGEHAGLDDPARGDSANIGFVCGKKCIAVIDTGGSLSTGRNLLAAIRARSALPICYVINTHVHFDHVLGNAAFTGLGAKFIGHENLAAAIEANRTFFSEQFARELEGGGVDKIIASEIAIVGEREIDLGDRKLLLRAHPLAHSNTDLSVVDLATKTLWTGDLVFVERLPILDGKLKGWLAWHDAFAAQTFALVIPGHGSPSADWPGIAEPQRAYLDALLHGARKAIADGVFLEDAIETMGRDSAAPWLMNDRHPGNVSKAYRELEWE